MRLDAIEKVVLNNIGMRYDELSVSTDAKEILDFAMLHTCVNLAREEIKINTKIPDIMAFGAAIPTVAGTAQYSLPADFDLSVTMYYSTVAGMAGTKLSRMYPEDLPSSVSLVDTGTPDSYLILGNTAGLLQIYLLLTPNAAGFILPLYKPILTELSLAADEDILMKKYSLAVINFATAFSFQLLKKDEKMYDKFYNLGLLNCSKIDFREKTADSNYRELPPLSIRNARSARTSV